MTSNIDIKLFMYYTLKISQRFFTLQTYNKPFVVSHIYFFIKLLNYFLVFSYINFFCFGIYVDKCRIGSGPQNEWYFFSHKDKKYPTGTRTNRAIAAGFWKATGRDKSIHLNSSKKIGLRKTLVFYTGRAPHGHKTEWIMHEYRLDDNENEIQV